MKATDLEGNDLEDGSKGMKLLVHEAGWDMKRDGTWLVCYNRISDNGAN